MNTVCHKQLHFGSLFGKEVIADFEEDRITSDACGFVLRELDERYGLTRRAAAALYHSGDPTRVIHELKTMLWIACISTS
jgi:hypothetical protein